MPASPKHTASLRTAIRTSGKKISNDALILAALEQSKKKKAEKNNTKQETQQHTKKQCVTEKTTQSSSVKPESNKQGITLLGIDPGSVCTGWGIIQELPNKELLLIDCGAIRPKGENFAARLGRLFTELNTIVAHFQPTEAAIEDVHVAHNIASALKLGQARGAIIAACASNNVPVADIRPSTVKKALVGTGSAQKEQVSTMVRHLLGIPAAKKYALDTTDALGIAIAYCNIRKLKHLL